MRFLADSRGGPPVQRVFVIPGRVHVSQNQSARIELSPVARVDVVHSKLVDGVGNFAHPTRERSGNFRSAFSAVDCGQRLDAALAPRNDSFAARTHRTRKQPVKPFCGKVWHVAGQDQIPWRPRRGQGGGDSRERSVSRLIRPALNLHVIGDHMQSEVCIPIERSDNRNFGYKWFDQSRCMKDQRNAAEIEKSFVATHARAGASGKNKSSDLAIALHDGPAILRLRAELAQRRGEF